MLKIKDNVKGRISKSTPIGMMVLDSEKKYTQKQLEYYKSIFTNEIEEDGESERNSTTGEYTTFSSEDTTKVAKEENREDVRNESNDLKEKATGSSKNKGRTKKNPK